MNSWIEIGLDMINSRYANQPSTAGYICQVAKRQEVSGELVVARGDAAEILQPSEAARDDVAVLVGALVVPDALLAAGFAWDDRLDFGDIILAVANEAVYGLTREGIEHDPHSGAPVF